MEKRYEMNTWDVRSLYMSGSLSTVARELARYKAYLVIVYVVSWDKGNTVETVNY